MGSTDLVCGDVRCLWPAGATLGEGTCWSVREQALYWVDILEQRLLPLHAGQRRARRLDAARTRLGGRRTRQRARADRHAAPRLRLLRPGHRRRCSAWPNPSRNAPATASTTASATRRAASGAARWTSTASPPPARSTASTRDGRCTRVFDAGFAVVQRAHLVARRPHDVLQRHGAAPGPRLRRRPGQRHARRTAALPALREGRRLSRRHDHRCRRAPVDRALGRRLRELPRRAQRR